MTRYISRHISPKPCLIPDELAGGAWRGSERGTFCRVVGDAVRAEMGPPDSGLVRGLEMGCCKEEGRREERYSRVKGGRLGPEMTYIRGSRERLVVAN